MWRSVRVDAYPEAGGAYVPALEGEGPEIFVAAGIATDPSHTASLSVILD